MAGSVDDDSIEARLLRRLDQIQSKFNRLNDENKIFKENNKKLGERVEELMPLTKKVDQLLPLNDEIQELKRETTRLKANNEKQDALIQRLNKQQRDNDVVSSAAGWSQNNNIRICYLFIEVNSRGRSFCVIFPLNNCDVF